MVSVRRTMRVLPLGLAGSTVCDESTALAIIGEALGERADMVLMPVERLCPAFFRLRSGVAGAVVQKFANYRLRLVIVGHPGHHGPTSGPVREWMREANQYGQLWFVADEAELDRRLAKLDDRVQALNDADDLA